MASHADICAAFEQRGVRYEDPHFPADGSSIGALPLDGPAQWLRPAEVFGPSARLFAPGGGARSPTVLPRRAAWPAGSTQDS